MGIRHRRKFDQAVAQQSEDIPQWLRVMRTITGITEEPGAGDNPKILAMRDEIKHIWGDVPGLNAYADTYQHDEQAWCSLTAAFCVSESGLMPPFGDAPVSSEDYWYDKYYWAKSWAGDGNYIQIGRPVPGAIVTTRTPTAARSRAAGRVMPTMPPLAAE